MEYFWYKSTNYRNSCRNIIWTHRFGQRTREDKMNYWVEYWKTISTENKNYYAQSQIIKWEKPDKKDIRKRFSGRN